MKFLSAFLISFLGAVGDADFNNISEEINGLIKSMWTPCLAIAGALAGIWGVYLGIKFWTAGGDEQKKKSAKSAVIQFVVGIVIIFVVAVGAPMLIAALATWSGH